MSRQGQEKVKTRSGHGQGKERSRPGKIKVKRQFQCKINVRLRQSNHNHNHNYNLMGFDTINLVHMSSHRTIHITHKTYFPFLSSFSSNLYFSCVVYYNIPHPIFQQAQLRLCKLEPGTVFKMRLSSFS